MASKLVSTLKRGVMDNVITSRNLSESLGKKIRRTFWATIYMLKALRIAAGSLWREQGLSEVIYQGRRCYISNWANSSAPTLAGKDFYQQNVPRSEIKNVIDVKELVHRFNFGLSSYMGNWYMIDVNRKVQ